MRTSRPRRPRRLRGLQARLLVWFLGAIALAAAASVVVTLLTRDGQNEAPTFVVWRHVQHQLAKQWDDPVATEHYVQQLRETTGLDLRVRRDTKFPGAMGRPRPGGLAFEDGATFVPVVRGGVVIGALELRTGNPRPQLWRVVFAFGAALLVLGAAARRVSKRLARPLEHLAQTAERFGGGDLSARTGIDGMPRRWVAEEVRDVGRAFDTMADRISRVVVEQRELLGAISHELRSPLGRARVALEIARERAPEAGAKPLDEVERQLVQVDAILGDLLASTRAGLGDVRLEEVVLVEWLRQRIDSEEGQVVLEVRPEVADARVKIDPALLGRALHNLLANAVNHGHPAGEPLVIGLRSASDPDRIEIAVADRGPGFSAAILPRAFEPFVTGDDPARSPGAHGMGLGLALVRRIVLAHAGVVAASNRVEGGAGVGGEGVMTLTRVGEDRLAPPARLGTIET